jgi:hypothetical protein
MMSRGGEIVKHSNRVRELRLAMQPRPWTQDRLVVAIEQSAAELNLAVGGRRSIKTTVSRWENGHVSIGVEYRKILKAVFDCTDDELGLEINSAGMAAGAAFGNAPEAQGVTGIVSQFAADWTGDLERRRFLRGAAYSAAAATTPALRWLMGEADQVVNNGSGTAVGVPHIETIREMTQAFRRIDNRFGGAAARESVMKFLAFDVAPLLRGGRYDSATGSALYSAAAEALQLAAWMTYDTGMHGLGQRYMGQALQLAQSAGDPALGAEILAGLSHQASYLKDSATAIDLARASQKTARQHGLGVLLAEAAVMEAHGHAVAGNGVACARALTLAETSLDAADRDQEPHWIGYFDEAYLSAKFGHCFKELGDGDATKRFALRSLEMDTNYLRGKAFNLALLATGHVQLNELDEASAVGLQAIELIQGMQSSRAIKYLSDLELAIQARGPTSSTLAFTGAVRPILAAAS